MADPKKLKAAVKEGGKKGVELKGCFEMGGMEFFTTKIDAADGDMDLLVAAMDAANKEPDPGEEEPKGGSGMVGKMLLSSNDDAVVCVCYVPENCVEKTTAEDWMKATLAGPNGDMNGELLEGTKTFAKGIVKANAEAGRFTMKDRDFAQTASVNYLVSKKLFEIKEEDDWVPDDDAGIEW
eukprot:CAMPEP_0184307926 /NCGR_PEP_ID=MMETSP1049-20130417/16530_1 /TAXON_ID=77928 /ORGANISM="Proteomonas sulcata, Strain CCMP704" /LENGTH=180 /DNA_ID=CAMNT_0026620515 /DNA_START=1 /DNA_END=543 /DNA_ORIENTATION=-